MERLYKLVILILFIYIFSCTTHKKEVKVLDSSSYKKPLWTEKSKWEDRDYIYFSNRVRTKKGPIEGLKESKEKLIKMIYPILKKKFIEEFEEKTSDIDFYDRDKIKFEFVNKLMELIDIEHLIPDGIYYEKVKENNTVCFYCYTYKAFSKEIINNKKRKTIEYLLKNYKDDKKKESELLKLKEVYW